LWQQVVTTRADPVREAYAQWLASQGAKDAAQLVTLQIEIAKSLGSGSAQAWVNSARPERDARALQKRLGDTSFHWKGFPARVVVTGAQPKLRAVPVEHVVLRGLPTGIFDALHAAGARALTIAASHAQAAQALVKHPLLHQLAWLRVQDSRLDAAFWDGVERAAPKSLLYVDSDRVSIEIEDDESVGIEEDMLKRPCWRCPLTTWGPRPTITRVLACADAGKHPQPGMFGYEVSRTRDVERPPKTFAEVVAPETWDPEKE
jgi:hypothetical protein